MFSPSILCQMPRMPADVAAFEQALSPNNATDFLPATLRTWQLTNTRYLLGPAAFYLSLNRKFDPAHPPFRIAGRFDIVPKPSPVQATSSRNWPSCPATNGAYALIEFTQALPRAKLYSNWQVNTNDQAVLEQLAAPSFDPERSVFVAGALPTSPAAGSANENAGTVEFASYAPKDIVLRSDGPAPAVLLLNDRYDPNWKVSVDGKPAPLLALQLHHARRLSHAGGAHHRVSLPAAHRAALRQPSGHRGWGRPAGVYLGCLAPDACFL